MAEDIFTQTLIDMSSEHEAVDELREKKLGESDFLLKAFMALLKAYMSRIGGSTEEEPKTYMMGA